MNHKKVNDFSERIIDEINTALSCLNLYLGHRLGLFEALAKAGSATPQEIAEQTGYNDRYLREWLECMTVNGYIDHESSNGHFSISPEHSIPLLDGDNPNYVAPFLYWVPSLTGVLTPLMEAFRTGGGVPYESYGDDALEAIGMGNRPMFLNDYVEKWIPAMPDVKARLEAGGRVADIGCGVGWSSIYLALGFPKVLIDAYDLDRESVAQAMSNVKEAGIEERVTFHLAAAEEIQPKEPYDLVTAFECIHDMAYPVKALRRMREILAPDGTVLVADEAVGENLEENRNFMGRFMYNFSVLHCLPQALIFPDAAGTGTVMGESTFRGYAEEAGFSKVDVLPIENPFWRFYHLTP
jgi:SAM-dependent methyltransferase